MYAHKFQRWRRKNEVDHMLRSASPSKVFPPLYIDTREVHETILFNLGQLFDEMNGRPLIKR